MGCPKRCPTDGDPKRCSSRCPKRCPSDARLPNFRYTVDASTKLSATGLPAENTTPAAPAAIAGVHHATAAVSTSTTASKGDVIIAAPCFFGHAARSAVPAADKPDCVTASAGASGTAGSGVPAVAEHAAAVPPMISVLDMFLSVCAFQIESNLR